MQRQPACRVHRPRSITRPTFRDGPLAAVLGEAVIGASRTPTRIAERYRRLFRRIGKRRAIVAVSRTLLIIVWELLSDPHARFDDLGPDFYDLHANPQRRTRNLIRELERLGHKVTVEPMSKAQSA